METFNFGRFHEKVYFAAGSHRAALRHLHDEGVRRVALICDESVRASGGLDILQHSLEVTGLPYDTHLADPAARYDEIVALAQRINARRYDCYLSLGGNFLNFVAKIVWRLADDPRFDVRKLDTDFARVQQRSGPAFAHRGRAIHVAIPAAYMLGGEYGHFLFASFGEGQLNAYLDAALLPTRLVLDPTLLTTVSDASLAAEGFDAFTHCIECFARDVDLPPVKAACLRGAKTVFDHLPALLANQGDRAARERMLEGLWCASIAVSNLFSGIVHSMTSMYTARLEVPHGAAHALTLPAAVGFLAGDEATAARLRELAVHLGVASATDAQAAHKLADATRDFAHRIGLATTVSGAGIELPRFRQLLPEMARGAADYQSTRLSSRPADAAQMRMLYEAAAA